jgi:hypothetical protein
MPKQPLFASGRKSTRVGLKNGAAGSTKKRYEIDEPNARHLELNTIFFRSIVERPVASCGEREFRSGVVPTGYEVYKASRFPMRKRGNPETARIGATED